MTKKSLPQQCETLPRPGFESGLMRPQRRVLTTALDNHGYRDFVVERRQTLA